MKLDGNINDEIIDDINKQPAHTYMNTKIQSTRISIRMLLSVRYDYCGNKPFISFTNLQVMVT